MLFMPEFFRLIVLSNRFKSNRQLTSKPLKQDTYLQYPDNTGGLLAVVWLLSLKITPQRISPYIYYTVNNPKQDYVHLRLNQVRFLITAFQQWKMKFEETYRDLTSLVWVTTNEYISNVLLCSGISGVT